VTKQIHVVEKDLAIVSNIKTDKWVEISQQHLQYKNIFARPLWYPELYGKSHEYMAGDTEQLFEMHKRASKTYNILKKEGWLNQKILYHIDVNGFRTDNSIKDYHEYKGHDNVLWCGCSLNWGTGINIEQTYSYILHKRIHPNKNYVNISTPGQGIDALFRYLRYWIPILKPTHVYIQHLWTSSRTDMWHPGIGAFESAKSNHPSPETIANKDNKLDHIDDPDSPTMWYISSRINPDKVPHKDWEKSLDFTDSVLYSPQPSLIRLVKNLDALKFLFWKHKVKGYIFPIYVDLFETKSKYYPMDFGRDCMHPGVQTNINWVDHYHRIIDGYEKCEPFKLYKVKDQTFDYFDWYGTSEVWSD